MLTEAEQSKLKKDVINFIHRRDIEVFDIKVSYYRNDLVIKILVDFREGGINLDDCSDLNRRMRDYLDRYEGLSGNYLLEISSPGINRAFNRLRDFVRVKGSSVDMWLNHTFEGKTHYSGKIVGVDAKGELISLETRNRRMNIPVGIVHKAKQKIT